MVISDSSPPTLVLSLDSGVVGDGITFNAKLNVSAEPLAVVEYSINGGSTWAIFFVANRTYAKVT
jgi:hypothetical protein